MGKRLKAIEGKILNLVTFGAKRGIWFGGIFAMDDFEEGKAEIPFQLVNWKSLAN
jgi:hypothetical protein